MFHGLVLPQPEKLDKICQVFQWLATRPRVSARAVERLLGHAVHVALLRRELLSIFRALYDFVQHNYTGRSRLWVTAAREARWAASLLKLCSADLTRPWDGEITCSDASLSGIAVAKRSLDSVSSEQIGSIRESWRYKAADPSMRPREVLVRSRDPFTDPETVKPINVDSDMPYVLDRSFQEIRQGLLEPHRICEGQGVCRQH